MLGIQMLGTLNEQISAILDFRWQPGYYLQAGPQAETKRDEVWRPRRSRAARAQSQLPPQPALSTTQPTIFPPSSSPVYVRATQSACRLSDNRCARRSQRPRRGPTPRARRSTPRQSRTCASTATPRCCSRASPASRERECALGSWEREVTMGANG